MSPPRAAHPPAPAAEFPWRGTRLLLLAARAAFHPETATLFAADLHLGRGAALRAVGLPVPGDGTAEDLGRLGATASALCAKRVVLLGDLVHARESLTPGNLAAFAEFRAGHPGLELVLVAGNHDRRALRILAEAGLRIEAPPFAAEPFACVHAPAEAPAAGPALAGHLHPAVSLSAGRESLTVPCFWLRGEVLVLPAFGGWTGRRAIRPGPGDRVWAAARGGVLEVPGR